MPYSLIRMKRIISGVSQLFTSMDKGFARVESDLTLLTRFRQICYESNTKLEASLLKLEDMINNSGNDPSGISITTDANNKKTSQVSPEVIDELINSREIISDSILMISDYIEEYAELWKKSFSLNALEKFKNLIINEFNLLENEIDTLQMRGIIDHRDSILKKSTYNQTFTREIKKD